MSKKETILLVDDDVEFIKSETDLLEAHGYSVISAHDGEEGLELAKARKPDLMVLDVMMATKTQGFEVARKIPSCDELRNMPVLMVTGIRNEMHLNFRLEPNETWLPVSRIMEKPIDPAMFIATVQELLRRRGEMDWKHSMTKRAGDILSAKESRLWTVAPTMTIQQAVDEMNKARIGALLVTESDKLVGMCTERDCLRGVILEGLQASKGTVGDVMTTNVICVTSKQTVEECMSLMTHKRIRHLPVMDEGRLVGIISIGDVVRMALSQKNFIIEQLEHYITNA